MRLLRTGHDPNRRRPSGVAQTRSPVKVDEAAARRKADDAVAAAVTKQINSLAKTIKTQPRNGRASSPLGQTQPGKYILYTVVKGDTLGAIASAAGISLSKLKTFNGLTSDNIRIGQKIKIPQ